MATFSLLAKHAALERHQAEVLVRILREVDAALPDRITTATAAGDRQKLRGIPVCGAGIGGTSPGSNPLTTLLGKEERRLRNVA